MDDREQAWATGASPEISFWRSRIGDGSPGTMAKGFQLRLDPLLPLQPLLVRFLDEDADSVHILDVGAGPVTWVGRVWGEREVVVVATDALADSYNEVLDEAGVRPPVTTLDLRTERLTAGLPASHFDLSFARNTLDHSLDPVACVEQMARVTRPGGVVLLQHAVNEGLEHDYRGFHQWNFSFRDGGVAVWNVDVQVILRDAVAALLEPIEEWVAREGETELVFGAYRRRSDA